MAPPRRDLRRIIDGVSLVLLESINRAGPAGGARAARGAGSWDSIVFNAIKGAVVSATDLAGLTSGRVHRFSNSKQNDSVVYFSDNPDPRDSHPRLSVKEKDTSSHADSYACSSGAPSSSMGNISNKDKVVVAMPDNNEVQASSSASHASVLDMPSSTQQRQQQQQQQQDSSSDEAPSTLFGQKQANSLPVEPSIPVKRRRPRERRVPSTPIGRALGFAGLGAGLAWGTIQESAKRIVYGTPNSSGKNSALSPFLSDQNAERLALALCRMRGAALKLGQMLSIQDESLVPAPILAALDIVRQGADVMPRSQLNSVLDSELGPDWSKKLKSFDYEPLAAASIGQVHRAVTKNNMDVAMKIQYPGVADSIDSDIENVKRLLDYTNLIPKGLFLDRAIKVAKEELSRECDYELEAANQKRFRQLLPDTEGVYVPIVIDELSSRKVLTTELVSGIPIDKVAALNQETRNYVGRKLLELTLLELFIFRFMQTDPNWSNFLYNEATNMINLIDFGAAREYRKDFVDDYLRMVMACADRDKEAVVEMSKRLGFLTGMESEVMLDAHIQASFIVGLPFSTCGSYDFRASNITSSVSHLGATMLKHRLTPPPDEAYSLHRKLSGAFLACIKLGVVVPCRDLLLQVYQQYRFSDENEETASYSAV